MPHKTPNPFWPGRPLPSEYLKGRDNIINKIVQNVGKGQSTIIVGPFNNQDSFTQEDFQKARKNRQCSIKEILKDHIIPVASYSIAFESLKREEVEAIAGDLSQLKQIPFDSDSFDFISAHMTQQYSFGVPKGNDQFLVLINDTLQKMDADGTYDELYCKMFSDATVVYQMKFENLTSSKKLKDCSGQEIVFPKKHIAEKGDTFWGLAERYYGKPEEREHICNANQKVPRKNCNDIKPGERLIIPQPPLNP